MDLSEVAAAEMLLKLQLDHVCVTKENKWLCGKLLLLVTLKTNPQVLMH
jgi:hypothetical protein